MVRGELIQDVREAERVFSEWDHLAQLLQRPFCAPAWMLAWWRNAAPEGAVLQVVAVFDEDDLIGLAPFFSVRSWSGMNELRFLASRTSVRAEPLATPTREREVANTVAEVLNRTRHSPDVLLFEGVPTTSRWPELLRTAWAGKREAYKHRSYPTLAPTLDLTGRDYEEWFRSRSSHFRQEVRRRRRHLDALGAEFRLAEGAAEVVDSLDAFFRLHHSRWSARGGSRVLNEQVQAMLLDAALVLVGEGRFRIWTITAQGEVISAHIFIAAGGEVAYWLGGFDHAWAKHGPAIQTVLKALEHAWSLGETRMDFGAGAQEYKYSFAEDQDVLESVMVAPRTRRYPATRARLAPRLVRESISIRLPSETREKLARLRRRN